jgi:hypothetical protein
MLLSRVHTELWVVCRLHQRMRVCRSAVHGCLRVRVRVRVRRGVYVWAVYRQMEVSVWVWV